MQCVIQSNLEFPCWQHVQLPIMDGQEHPQQQELSPRHHTKRLMPVDTSTYSQKLPLSAHASCYTHQCNDGAYYLGCHVVVSVRSFFYLPEAKHTPIVRNAGATIRGGRHQAECQRHMGFSKWITLAGMSKCLASPNVQPLQRGNKEYGSLQQWTM